MLKFRDFDLINENINKARAVLRQVGVEETDPRFVKLRSLLKNNLGYAGKFTEWMFLQKVDFSRLENLYNRIKDERLSKPIDGFKTPEEVIDSLVRSNVETDINQILNSIPGRTRQFLKDCGDYKNLESFLRQNSGKKGILMDFFSKKGGRYGDYDDVIDELINDLEKIVDSKTILDISKISKTSKDVRFIFEDDNFLVVAVNYRGIKEVGSNYWCIVEDEDTFRSYVTDVDYPTIQLVIYFKDRVPFVDDRSVLGVTWKMSEGGSIDAAHWEDDEEYYGDSFDNFLKSLNSKFVEVLPELYDTSKTVWMFLNSGFYMPELMSKIEAWEASGIVKPIENFIRDWLDYASDEYSVVSVKNLSFYKDVIPILKSKGIKLVFTWEDIILFELFDIAQITKSMYKEDVFGVMDDYLHDIIEDNKKRRNFYLWLIQIGYDLESRVRNSQDILDLIGLEIIPIEKLYKKLDFGEVVDLHTDNRYYILDWIRDNDLPFLLSKKDFPYYILETLSKQAKKYDKEIKEIFSDKDIFRSVKGTEVFRNLLLTGNDDLRIELAKSIIPKEVLDQFDVVLTKKVTKEVDPKVVKKTKGKKV